MKTITTTAELETLCTGLSKGPYITIDTEFMREHTFWPELCLIQLANDDLEAVVDPLAKDLDLAPFFDLMSNEAVLKVFHAARQDLEIMHHLGGFVPKPIFDTQVAAMVCGFGDSIGYANLVKKIANVEIDKSSRFTDWRRRPLKDKQVTYALGDVTHLRDVYAELKTQLETSGRAKWLQEEMAVLADPATYEQKPADAWKRLKMRVKNQKSLAVLMDIAEWRESFAQKQDVPRNRVLRDEALYDIANQMPKSEKELSDLRTSSNGFARSSKGKEIVTLVLNALERDVSDLPKLARGKPMTPQAAAVGDLLRVLLKAVCARNDVAAKLIANSDDLDKIATSDDADVPAMKGWRREMFGDAALAIKHGRLALAIRDGEVSLIEIEPDDPAVDAETD